MNALRPESTTEDVRAVLESINKTNPEIANLFQWLIGLAIETHINVQRVSDNIDQALLMLERLNLPAGPVTQTSEGEAPAAPELRITSEESAAEAAGAHEAPASVTEQSGPVADTTN